LDHGKRSDHPYAAALGAFLFLLYPFVVLAKGPSLLESFVAFLAGKFVSRHGVPRCARKTSASFAIIPVPKTYGAEAMPVEIWKNRQRMGLCRRALQRSLPEVRILAADIGGAAKIPNRRVSLSLQLDFPRLAK
jgi:hypothetical protein